MIVGNGMMATAFEESHLNSVRNLIFASGVSNSKSTNSSDFEREKKLLLHHLEKYPEKVFLYFSTCSIYNPAQSKSPYVSHKKEMEDIVRANADSYYIFRVSNLVGKGGNSATIFRYLYESIQNGNKVTLWKNAYRNLLDIDDAVCWINTIVKNSIELSAPFVNLANPRSFPVVDIYNTMELLMNKAGEKHLIEMGGDDFQIELAPKILKQAADCNIDFTDDYLTRLIKKYCL